jgi:hypothetical protein
MKVCTKCHKSLHVNSFHKKGANVNPKCKDCCAIYAKAYREKNIDKVMLWKGKYRKNNPYQDRIYQWQRAGIKITPEKYEELFSEQSGKCAICGVTFGNNRCAKLFVDHDHKTGMARGLLCHKCNSLIGYANDSNETLQPAIDYLARKISKTEEA